MPATSVGTKLPGSWTHFRFGSRAARATTHRARRARAPVRDCFGSRISVVAMAICTRSRLSASGMPDASRIRPRGAGMDDAATCWRVALACHCFPARPEPAPPARRSPPRRLRAPDARRRFAYFEASRAGGGNVFSLDHDDLTVTRHSQMQPLLHQRRELVSTRGVPDLALQLGPLRAKIRSLALELLHHPRLREAERAPPDDARCHEEETKKCERDHRTTPAPRHTTALSGGYRALRHALNLALRARGFRSASSGDAVTGLLVTASRAHDRDTYTSAAAAGRYTTRSSLETRSSRRGPRPSDTRSRRGCLPGAVARGAGRARARDLRSHRSRQCAQPERAERNPAGPVRGPSAPRIAPTRSSLVTNGRFARRRTISRASRIARRSSAYSRKIAPSSTSSAVESNVAASRAASVPMRMSSGTPSRNEKPREGSSSWCEETPRSSRMPSNRWPSSSRIRSRSGVVAQHRPEAPFVLVRRETTLRCADRFGISIDRRDVRAAPRATRANVRRLRASRPAPIARPRKA